MTAHHPRPGSVLELGLILALVLLAAFAGVRGVGVHMERAYPGLSEGP